MERFWMLGYGMYGVIYEIVSYLSFNMIQKISYVIILYEILSFDMILYCILSIIQYGYCIIEFVFYHIILCRTTLQYLIYILI